MSTLAADGGNGGVFVNNDSASLTIGNVNGLSGLTAALGDLFLANTGNMLVSSNVSGTGHITLTSDGDLTQSGAIQTQGSTILAYAAGTLTTEAGASTTLGSGEIGYDSDTELVLDGSMSASTSNYGVIVLKAPQLDLVSNNPILSAEALLVDITNLDQTTKSKLLNITSGTETLQLIDATLVKSPNFWAMSCSGESAGTSTSAGTGNWTSCQP